MPSVICPQCKHFYEVDEADNGKECECPCGHEFRIEIIPEIKLVPISQKPVSRNKWKTLLQTRAVIGIFIICLFTFRVSSCMMHNDDNNPFRKMANSLVGLESINRRGIALDEYLQVVKHRTERDRKLEREIKIHLDGYLYEIKLTEERIAKLNEENAPYDEISSAMSSLDLSKSFYEHFKELQERLDRIKAKNPMDDPAIKAAYEKQTKLQNRVN